MSMFADPSPNKEAPTKETDQPQKRPLKKKAKPADKASKASDFQGSLFGELREEAS
jgi:hypothetical protein